MFTLSAFADEISPDPQKQIDVLNACEVKHIEFRSILGTNVLALSDLQIQEFKSLLELNGFNLSAIGSPIGKIRIDEPFEPHQEKLKRAIELCKVFDTPNIRIFSYYPPHPSPSPPDGGEGLGVRGTDWPKWRGQVIDRLTKHCELAQKAKVRLIHENEHRIYGDDPVRVLDVMKTLRQRFGPEVIGAVNDPANYVFCGFDPWQGWEMTKQYVVHHHIKDWKKGAEHGSLAGEGDGQMVRILADSKKMGYDGFATLEPHLLGGGPTGGVTGPELFPKAVAALRKIIESI
jgi:sugar phosphate isomerase/epimerase